MSISPVNFNETFISCVPEFIFLSQKLITPTPPPPNLFMVIFMLVQSPLPPTRKHHGYRFPQHYPQNSQITLILRAQNANKVQES